jgi:hypothetical protein
LSAQGKAVPSRFRFLLDGLFQLRQPQEVHVGVLVRIVSLGAWRQHISVQWGVRRNVSVWLLRRVLAATVNLGTSSERPGGPTMAHRAAARRQRLSL